VADETNCLGVTHVRDNGDPTSVSGDKSSVHHIFEHLLLGIDE